MKEQLKNDEWFNHEGLDRTSMIMDQLDNAFWGSANGLHPSLDTKEKVKLYKKAMSVLGELYQKIGEAEFPEKEFKDE